MPLPSTYALSDSLSADALSRSLGAANTIYADEELLNSSDLLTYSARRGNWAASPAPIIRTNGAPATGFSQNLVSGSVTFTTALDSTAIVTATYATSVFDSVALTALLTEAFFRLEAALAVQFDDTLLPRSVLSPLVTIAHILALRSLVAARLDLYLWEIDGKRVDKSRVTSAFLQSINTHEAALQTDLVFLRAQFMGSGATIVSNLDMGLPPNIYSKAQPDA